LRILAFFQYTLDGIGRSIRQKMDQAWLTLRLYEGTMDLGISGKVAIVTGGSQGIGKAIATQLAAEGVLTVIAARNLAALQQVAAEIEGISKGEVLPVQADVTDVSAVKKLVANTVGTFGGVDILVNNAAGSGSGALSELTDKDWLHHLDVKLVGYVRCAREVIPHMKRKGWGRIVNIGGEAARGNGGYASGAANSAVVNFSKKLSDEVAAFGITVNAIHPGSTRTRRREHAASRKGITLDELVAEQIKRIPIGRLIEPDEIAYTVLYLASAKATAITGQVLGVDGGSTRGIYY
jgi:NAD(P)-dependent dehydrogenase (short-subunit alcohol dehydrogenase family)